MRRGLAVPQPFASRRKVAVSVLVEMLTGRSCDRYLEERTACRAGVHALGLRGGKSGLAQLLLVILWSLQYRKLLFGLD